MRIPCRIALCVNENLKLMKIKPTLMMVMLIVFFQSTAQQTAKVTPDGIGYLQYLPDGYYNNSNRYPVVIALHGVKEKGTSSTDAKLVMHDLPRVANVGLPKYVKYGKKYPFILISPQLKSKYGMWPADYVMQVINHVKNTLRIDYNRIYLTGLSLGGYGVWQTAGAYPEVFAAIGPICSGGNALDKAQAIARANIAVWAFHGGSDRIVSQKVTTTMVNAINSSPKKPNPLAKVTIFPTEDHIVWDKVYNSTSLLTWMLSVRKGSHSSEATSNNKPVANAGHDRTITLPANSVTIDGSAADKDGKVISYMWTKVSGGGVKLAGTNGPQLTASALTEGSYVFRLTAKDNAGATGSDEVQVTVARSTSENIPPVANAGPDKVVQLPHNSMILRGTATDKDGSISTYNWRKVSGGHANVRGSNSTTLNVSGLEKGTYVFQLTVKDNGGATSTDNVVLKVYNVTSNAKNDVELGPVKPGQRFRKYPGRRRFVLESKKPPVIDYYDDLRAGSLR
jgi:hypothetical protein